MTDDAFKEMFGYTQIAIATITEKSNAKPEFGQGMSKEKEGCQGTIECPKCKGKLNYSVAGGNHHIWGKCETDGCLSWMM